MKHTTGFQLSHRLDTVGQIACAATGLTDQASKRLWHEATHEPLRETVANFQEENYYWLVVRPMRPSLFHEQH